MSKRIGGLLMVVLLAGVSAWGQEPEQAETEGPVATESEQRRQDTIEKMLVYFLDLHSKHLQSRDWSTRAMACVNLSRIDDPRMTDKLLEVVRTDRDPLVRVYAWECLHSRAKWLTEEQRGLWLNAGCDLASRGCLAGHMRSSVLRAIATRGPTPENRRALQQIFTDTNMRLFLDHSALETIQQTVNLWQDDSTIRLLTRAMNSADHAARAHYCLMGLNPDVADPDSFKKLGTVEQWRKMYALWTSWLGGASLTPWKDRPPYTEGSQLIAPPEKMENPHDQKWRPYLELTSLRVSAMDVVFVVDATGSMGEVIRWLRTDMPRMMRCFAKVSLEPRIGLVFYRDKGEEFLVKEVLLTDDADALLGAIGETKADGGGDIPEAVYDGLNMALRRMNWTRTRDAHKAIVLLGDAPPHPQSMSGIEDLVTSRAASSGILVYAGKVETEYASRWDPDKEGGGGGRGRNKAPFDIPEFDQIAEWGGGTSILMDFASLQEVQWSDQVARQEPPEWRKTHSNLVVNEVLKGMVPKEHHGQIEWFVNVLMEQMTPIEPETHEIRPPWVPRPPRPRKPHKPRPPKDPQN